MYKEMLELLRLDNFYGVSDNIDFAKGVYKYPESIKDCGKLLKRIMTKNKIKNG